MDTIIGFDKTEIPVREENDFTDVVGIIYPGQGYTLTAPSLFYLHPLFIAQHIHYVGIDTQYGNNIKFMASDKETRNKWIDIDSDQIGAYIKKKSKKYKRRIFIAKSIGTAHVYNQLKNGYIQRDDVLIFQTPIIPFDELQNLLFEKGNPSLVIYGTKDPIMIKKSFSRIKSEKNVAVLEIENAGHSFEVGTEIEASIDNLKEVMKGVNSFLEKVLNV